MCSMVGGVWVTTPHLEEENKRMTQPSPFASGKWEHFHVMDLHEYVLTRPTGSAAGQVALRASPGDAAEVGLDYTSMRGFPLRTALRSGVRRLAFGTPLETLG
jgi:hypothetical protein